MKLAAILLFVLSANLDNFTVALTYGMRKIRIGTAANLLIAGISGGGTLGCMLAGGAAARFLPPWLSGVLGGLLMAGIGLWSIADTLRRRPAPRARDGHGVRLGELLDAPEAADTDRSGSIDPHEAIVLALALSINNLGLGLGASIAGFDPWLTAGLTVAVSLAAIRAGCFVGRRWAVRLLGRLAPLIAGAAVAALGIFELLSALL